MLLVVVMLFMKLDNTTSSAAASASAHGERGDEGNMRAPYKGKKQKEDGVGNSTVCSSGIIKHLVNKQDERGWV